MSMNGLFRPISARLYEQLRRDPAAMPRVLGQTEDSMLKQMPASMREQVRADMAKLLEQLPAEMRQELLAQQATRNSAPMIDERELGAILDIHKGWNAVHFLITGNAHEPLPEVGAAVLGGIECGGDAGHGPARMIGPDDVAIIAAALEAPEVVRKRFDPVALSRAGVYPGVWGDPADADELAQWIIGAYAEVRALYVGTAAKKWAVVAWLS